MMMPGCDESVPTRLKVFSTLRTLGTVDMSQRASVVRCASFLWKSVGSVQNSVMALEMGQGMPGFVVSA